jgi:hypothetical protein
MSRAPGLKGQCASSIAGSQHPVPGTGIASLRGDAVGCPQPPAQGDEDKAMKVIYAALVSLALSGAANSQVSEPAAQRAEALPRQGFAIAGIRLGMSPAEVAAAMRSAGYALRTSSRGRSWEAMLTRRIASTRAGARVVDGSVVVGEWYAKGDEEVEVNYVPTRAGSAVSEVEYAIRSAAITPERFRAQVQQRYGRPNQLLPTESFYCTRSERACNSLDYPPNELPTLAMYLGSEQMRLVLRQGERARQAYEADIAAEIARRAPPVAATTF